MNIGASVLRDLDIDNLVAAVPTYTQVGAIALKERLSNPITDELEILKRQAQIKAIRSQSKGKGKAETIYLLRQQLRETEEDVHSVANAAKDNRHAEYYNQILWPAKSFFAFLNKIDLFNETVVFFRTLFLPGLSILLPIFVFVAPLVFYNLIINEPLTMKGYFDLLQSSLKKAVPSVLGKPRFAGTGGVLEVGEQFLHLGVSVAMFGASIWNQVSSAITMRSAVADMRRRADAVRSFAEAARALAVAMDLPFELTALETPGQLALFGTAWNSPALVTELLAVGGRLDMLAAIALTKRTCFPSSGSSVELTDLYHPSLSATARVYNSMTIGSGSGSGSKNHVLLTGPNRGGKSTLLKALGAAVLMSQTLGIVFARKAVIPVFNNLITGLSPQDVIGRMSLFEAEIEFAKEVKAVIATTPGPTFLMMDEIFHGTNAHDGVEASQVFLDDLYAGPSGVYSVVSTHYMDLPARYGADRTQNLCMDSSIDPADPDRIIYTYKVCDGVNKLSSVREILRERGLLASVRSPARKNTDDASKA